MTIEAFNARIRDSFWDFLRALWADRNLNRLHPLGWVEQDVADWIQHGPTKSGILAPRSFGKTHLVTASVTCWDLLRDPNAKILIVSKSERSAIDTIKIVRAWISACGFLQHLDPANRGTTRQQARDSRLQFDVGTADDSRTPSVTAKSITGQLAGTRASRIIPDDIETENNSQTQGARARLAELVHEFTAIASYGERRITYVGTYHHEESVYKVEADRGVAFRTWPELYPLPEDQHLGLAPSVASRLASGQAKSGQIVCDYRFTPEFVAERKARGRRWYALQCQLISNLDDSAAYPLRLRDLIVHPVSIGKAPAMIAWGESSHGVSTAVPNIENHGFSNDRLYGPIRVDERWQDYNTTIGFLDPAGHGQDDNGLTILSELNGFFWVHVCQAIKGSATDPDVANQIIQTCRDYGVRMLWVEDFAMQGLVADVLASMMGNYRTESWSMAVERFRPPQIQKELRIIGALEPVFNQHRVVVDPRIASNKRFQYQVTRMTGEKNALEHEDMVDSLAGAVLALQHVLRIDPATAFERRKKSVSDELAKVLAKIIRNRGQ